MVAQIKEVLPPLVRVHYKKGDLIIKQGDYGVCIYKIIKGKVRIFKENEGKEVTLRTVGPGELLGEMNFFNKSVEPYPASACALTDVDMEVWHCARLTHEYDRMPPVIKTIAQKMMSRLWSTNVRIRALQSKLEEQEERNTVVEPRESRRKYYRKQVDLVCFYRPVGAPPEVRYPAKIKDISMSGAGMELETSKLLNEALKLGELLHLSITLPNGKRVECIGQIVHKRKGSSPTKLFTGLAYVDLSEDARKKLGFFLLP